MKNKEVNIAIIPARLGSKRIKQKNIKKFFNKPIILHVIEILKKTKLFNYIVVTSDSNKILKIAKKGGSNISIKRPKYLSDDKTDTKSVIIHSIKELEKIVNIKKVFCIYPTSVFTKVSTIHKAFKLEKENNTFIFTASNYAHPIERSFILKKKKLKLNFPKLINTRTQDLEDNYHDAAQFYFADKKIWLSNSSIISNNSIFIKIPRSKSHDIDNPDDWKIAENFWKTLNKKK